MPTNNSRIVPDMERIGPILCRQLQELGYRSAHRIQFLLTALKDKDMKMFQVQPTIHCESTEHPSQKKLYKCTVNSSKIMPTKNWRMLPFILGINFRMLTAKHTTSPCINQQLRKFEICSWTIKKAEQIHGLLRQNGNNLITDQLMVSQ